MATHDPHKDEPTVQVDEGLVRQWYEAESNASRWKSHAAKLRGLIEEQIGDAFAGMVGNDKVITFRPTARYAEAALIKAYPDLTQHFMRPVTNEVFDLEAFQIRHPEIAEQFRVRSFRAVSGE